MIRSCRSLRPPVCRGKTSRCCANDGTPVKTKAYAVTEGFFDVFGLPMTLGGYTKPAARRNNGPPTVVISYRMWQDMYGGDPAVIGKPIRFAEIAPTTIVGGRAT